MSATLCPSCTVNTHFIHNRGNLTVPCDCECHGSHSPRTGETPEQILDRLAKELGCEPRQVCDRVIAMLEERKRVR